MKQQTAGNTTKMVRKQLVGKKFLNTGITLTKKELWQLVGYM